MSENYPQAISHDAYVTLITTGLPTSIGNLKFNELTFFSMTGPNFYGSNALAYSLGAAASFSSSQVLFMFTDTIKDYTNQNLGSTTLDIGGVGIYYDGSDIHLCPVAPDGTLMTAYAGVALNLMPEYTEAATVTINPLCAVMTYQEQNGGYVPSLGVGGPINITQHPDAYLKAHNSYSLGYFNLVGLDIFEYGLFGKYWNNQDSAPETDQNGNGGDFDFPDYQLETPAVPTDGALASKMVKGYVCLTSELDALGQFMWDNNFFNTLVKNWADPMQNIIGCFTLPINSNLIPSHASNITIGNTDSGISSHAINTDSEYIELDFGYIEVHAPYKNFADYDGKVTIYLPFCGYTDIDINDCVDGKIYIKYHVDLLTGDCVAYIEAMSEKTKAVGVSTHLIDQKTGNMATQIPLSQSNYLSVINTMVGCVGSAITKDAGGVATGLMNMHPTYSKTGNIGGSVGKMSYPYPYALLHWGMYGEPGQYRQKKGYTSNIYTKLNNSDVSAFIKVTKGTFNGSQIPCTGEELDMITDLLENGIYTRDEKELPNS